PAAERSIARLCRQMRALDDWLTGEAAALLQAATVPGGYDVTVLRRAEGPVLDAALHALVSPVRDAEEKYISLLHFLVLKGEGAVQLTPDVNYKIRDGLL
ncbi:MAG TPA: tRNA(Ile)-lysidine synthetase, partial [Subdoligranulum sp.]|nr:tRNA(Ile)-lysidine synthetase [Subdoligranulum sp.]